VLVLLLAVLVLRSYVQRERRRKHFHFFISYRVSRKSWAIKKKETNFHHSFYPPTFHSPCMFPTLAFLFFVLFFFSLAKFVCVKVDADLHLAKELFDQLSALTIEGQPVSVFLDRERLEVGGQWRQQFLAGLRRSCVFVVLASHGALRPALAVTTKVWHRIRCSASLTDWTLPLRLRLTIDLCLFPPCLLSNGALIREKGGQSAFGDRDGTATKAPTPVADVSCASRGADTASLLCAI
jgi:hypothetical protein